MQIKDVNGQYPEFESTEQSDLVILSLAREALRESHRRRLFDNLVARVGKIIFPPEMLLETYETLFDDATKLAAQPETPAASPPSLSDEN